MSALRERAQRGAGRGGTPSELATAAAPTAARALWFLNLRVPTHPLPSSLFFAVPPQGKIKSLEQVYLFSMPVKEYQIVESFLGPALKDEVMKIMPVQKQTRNSVNPKQSD